MYLANNTLLQGGKYKIVRHISSGGFGNTYEGIHTMMDTKVAIKEFFPKMFCNREENTSHITVATQSNKELVDKLRKKFNEEAKAVFQMKHENIVRVLDIFEENGTAYYVMEYIDGKSLNDITKERGALPEAEAVGYIRQVADALKYVHSLNRLHLDIKPGNIMIDKNGKAILIDFGASKHYDDESGENTSTLMGVNTKGYAPIEQSTQSFTKFSPATDVYALGATLYKLLTGMTPPDANLLMAKEETLAPLSGDISASTNSAVLKAMTLVRADRPQNVDLFLSLLDSKGAGNSDDESTIWEEKEVKRWKKLIERVSLLFQKARIGRIMFGGIVFVIISIAFMCYNSGAFSNNKEKGDKIEIDSVVVEEEIMPLTMSLEEKANQYIASLRNGMYLVATFTDSIRHCIYIHDTTIDQGFIKYDLDSRTVVNMQSKLDEDMGYVVKAIKCIGDKIYIIANNNALSTMNSDIVFSYDTFSDYMTVYTSCMEAKFIKGNMIEIIDRELIKDAEYELDREYSYSTKKLKLN